MTDDVKEEEQTDIADRCTENDRNGRGSTPPDRPGSNHVPIYVVRLRKDLQITDVTRMLHYLTDFGSGDSRGHALDGGWSIRLGNLSDLQLLSSQCADLIDGHDIEYIEASP